MGSPPYAEWEQCGAVLRQIDGAVQWWLGDWLNYGEHAYGEQYSQARQLYPDAPTPMPDSVVIERRSEAHSEKPALFRDLIEQLYPLGRRLELFGRREVEGWTVYGNQLQPDRTRMTAGTQARNGDGVWRARR